MHTTLQTNESNPTDSDLLLTERARATNTFIIAEAGVNHNGPEAVRTIVKCATKIADYCLGKDAAIMANGSDLSSIERLDDLETKPTRVPSSELTDSPFIAFLA